MQYLIHVCSKLRVKTTTNAAPQEDRLVTTDAAAAQNNQEGIYSLLQPSEDNDIVILS